MKINNIAAELPSLELIGLKLKIHIYSAEEI
jgi:hypothetical protein